jgi:hypothetical protein
MASLRKKYADHVEVGVPRQDEPPVSVPPTGAAKLPDEPAADVKPPPEMLEVQSPVEKAEKDAIALQLRLKEMEHAEQLSRHAAQQPPQAEPPPPQQQEPIDPVEFVLANTNLPERAKGWLRQHPEYVLDPEKNAELQHFHWKARKEAEDFSDGYYSALERHLGFRPAAGGDRVVSAPPPPPPRSPTPPRQQPRTSVAYSAPPTREAPSMTTGRMPSAPVRLTAEQKELCRSLGLSEAQYAEELRKMEAMKQSGQII